MFPFLAHDQARLELEEDRRRAEQWSRHRPPKRRPSTRAPGGRRVTRWRAG